MCFIEILAKLVSPWLIRYYTSKWSALSVYKVTSNRQRSKPCAHCVCRYIYFMENVQETKVRLSEASRITVCVCVCVYKVCYRNMKCSKGMIVLHPALRSTHIPSIVNNPQTICDPVSI